MNDQAHPARRSLRPGQVQSLRRQIAQAGGLVNAADLARVWNVSRARVSELQSLPDFPEPIGTIGERPAWLLEQCDRWRVARMRGGR